MSKSNNLMLYLTAVLMAKDESKGSGELNKYDHVAKDLFEPEFELHLHLTDGIGCPLSPSSNEFQSVQELASKYE